MEFLDDKKKRGLNHMQNVTGDLYSRLVYRDTKNPEDTEAGLDQWENPDIDAVLDNRALRLLTKQEVMDQLNAIREYLRNRLAVLKDSREDISDFILQITEGSEMEKRLDDVMKSLDMLKDKMYEEEAGAAYDTYKEDFDKAVEDILGTKAEIQNLALEKFIEKQPPYLERVMKKARRKGQKDIVELVQEAKLVKEQKSLDEVRNTVTWLSGDENDMSPLEYRTWSEKLDEYAKKELEEWLMGKIDDDQLNRNYSAILDEARARGGQKAVIKLRMLRTQYRRTRESYELTQLTYIRNIFGEDGGEGLIQMEIRNVQEGIDSGQYTDTQAASEIWRRLATMTEHASSKADFHIRDGELKGVQDFIGELRTKFEHTREIDFAGIVTECDKFRDGLAAKEQKHEEGKARYKGLLDSSKQDLEKVTHDSLVYGFVLKDLTEKETARGVLSGMKDEMAHAMELLKGDFATGDMATMQAAAYTLARVDEFFEIAAATDVVRGNRPPKKSDIRTRKPVSMDNLLGDINAFEGHEMDRATVVTELKVFDTELGGLIEQRIRQVGRQVRFVDREGFDNFFNGQQRDNFQGLPGAFHNGTIFIVYPLDTLNKESVERMYKVLTHESIHYTMHEPGLESTMNSFLNTLLYKEPNYTKRGLDRALRVDTLGGHVIYQFMKDRGDEFQDWIQKRTDIRRGRVSNKKITFEDVVKNEDAAREILEEAITVYLTYYALHGKQAKMMPPYLDYLRQFHETPEGQEMFDKFLPDAKKTVSLGADAADESGVPAGFGAAEGAEETTGDDITPDLDGLISATETVGGTTLMIERLLQELYGKDDYEDILKDARGDLDEIAEELGRMREQEKETGVKIPEDTRQKIHEELKRLDDELKEQLLGKLQKEQTKRDENPEEEWSYLERLWNETTFVAVDDVLKIFKDGWAYLSERRELRRDRVSSLIGESVATTERMKSYFSGLQQSVQNRDVSKWKEIYTDKDPNTLNQILDKAEDINQVKAIFEMKAETYGDFFFRNKQTLGALERISGKKVETYFQAKAVYDKIYGIGEADGLERKNDSTRRSKVSEAEEMGKAHADNLGVEWMQMIGALQRNEWVDAARFEGFINYAIKNGKSYLRQVLWVIAKGFQLGILDHRTLVQMGGSEMIVNSPHIEYIGKMAELHEAGIPYKNTKMTELEYIATLDLYDESGGKTDVRKQPPPTGKQVGDWIKYEKWLLYKVDKDEELRMRHGKIKSKLDQVDHDYVQDYWWEFDRSSYESIFSERSGSVQFIQDQGLANVYAQFVTNSLYWTDGDLESKYGKWFKTDRLLTEENYDNDGNAFQVKSGEKQRLDNKTVLTESKLNRTGALYQGVPMRCFRNLTYYAYRESGGNMQGARDIMMAGAMDLGIKWVPEPTIREFYRQKGWDYTRVERLRGRINVRALPEAPKSHRIMHGGTSMENELGNYPNLGG